MTFFSRTDESDKFEKTALWYQWLHSIKTYRLSINGHPGPNYARLMGSCGSECPRVPLSQTHLVHCRNHALMDPPGAGFSSSTVSFCTSRWRWALRKSDFWGGSPRNVKNQFDFWGDHPKSASDLYISASLAKQGTFFDFCPKHFLILST